MEVALDSSVLGRYVRDDF